MSDSADDIVKRMQNVRREVSDDVKGLVQSARTLTDWRYHVRHHPWLCAGLALGAGYLLVPKKRPLPSAEAHQLAELLKKYHVALQPQHASSSGGLLKALIGMALPVLTRTAMTMAQNRFAALHSGAFSQGDEEETNPYHIPR
jgi:hypothetical protein